MWHQLGQVVEVMGSVCASWPGHLQRALHRRIAPQQTGSRCGCQSMRVLRPSGMFPTRSGISALINIVSPPAVPLRASAWALWDNGVEELWLSRRLAEPKEPPRSGSGLHYTRPGAGDPAHNTAGPRPSDPVSL
jgi:hypothetical protein